MKDNTNTTTALYAVSLESAEVSIADFKAEYPEVPTKAFTIHADDFLQALGYSQEQIIDIVSNYPLPYRHARLYLGLDTGANTLKLFLVPVLGARTNPAAAVKLAGTDEIPTGEYKAYVQDQASVGPHVYDLIAPCPGTCDLSSPLYQAGE